MKDTLFLLILPLFLIGCHLSPVKSVNPSDDNMIQLIRDYGQNLDSLAEYILTLSPDDESSWVRDEIHERISDLQNNDIGVFDGISRISAIQSLIGYGMSYLMAQSFYSLNPEYCQKTLMVASTADSIYSNFKAQNFTDTLGVLEFEMQSLIDMKRYLVLVNMYTEMSEDPSLIPDNQSSESWDILEMFQEIRDTGEYSNTELFRIYAPMEGTLFFKTFLKWLELLIKDEVKRLLFQNEIIEAANFFDDSTHEISAAIDEDRRIHSMSDSEFASYLTESTTHKIRFLNILIYGLEDLEESLENPE